jgi:hypothetical protein
MASMARISEFVLLHRSVNDVTLYDSNRRWYIIYGDVGISYTIN